MEDTKTFVGKDVTLEVEFSKPGQKPIWLKDGKKITSKDKQYKAITDGTKCKLVLSDADIKDTGKYKCRLEDLITEATLTVEGMSIP